MGGYAASHPVDVVYTGMNPADMAQAVQLAGRSNEAPDVMNVNGDRGYPRLAAGGGMVPAAGRQLRVRQAVPEGSAGAEGFTKFDGKLYSFPIFSLPPEHSTSLWYFNDRMAGRGLRPGKGRRQLGRRSQGREVG